MVFRPHYLNVERTTHHFMADGKEYLKEYEVRYTGRERSAKKVGKNNRNKGCAKCVLEKEKR